MPRKFYVVIEVEDFVYDESLNGFEKIVDKEIESAAKDLRELLKESYINENKAT